MPRVSILLLVVCAGCLFEKSVGFNYYIQTGLGSPGLISYPLIAPYPALWDPNCDKKKEGGGSGEEGGSKEGASGEEGGSKEGGSSEEGGSKEGGSSEEGGESKEGGSSESSGEESKEGESESKEGEGKSEESGSSEEGEKKEGSSEESGEKKKEEKKKPKYVFPPRTYGFPPSQVQQILYSPLTSYSYVPYKASYVVQPPVATYPVKSSYRYVPVPATAAVVNGYTTPIVNRLVNSPITKIVYSSSLNYPQVPKTIVSPGARVYSVPGSWNGAYSYYKK